jgi:hypothetical protein
VRERYETVEVVNVVAEHDIVAVATARKLVGLVEAGRPAEA